MNNTNTNNKDNNNVIFITFLFRPTHTISITIVIAEK